jgi:hypothetical protein
VVTVPVASNVGAGEVDGKMMISQLVAFPVSTQFMVALEVVKFVPVMLFGVKHVPGAPHVIFAIQPGLFTELSLINLKVKLPSELVEVKDPGFVVPQKAPGKVNEPVPVSFPLENCGALVLLPLYMYNPSKFGSTSNEVKVTVTTSFGLDGNMVTV